jgi:cytochrome d ubiquinol oxidase subunit II
MLTAFGDHPWRLVFPALMVVALAAGFVWQRAGRWKLAFLASCALIAGLLSTAAAGLYPNVLPAREHQPFGLTIHNAASGDHALGLAIAWWWIGIVLAVGYFVVAYRVFMRDSRA